MYTQCANCETIFQLSAEVLRAAGGQVRCGRCGEVFNALARLAEDADAFAVGESPLDMETLADQILESTAPPPAIEPPAPAHITPLTPAPAPPPPADEGPPRDELAQADVEFARLQVLESSMDSLLEFTVPPGELDQVFVDALPRAPSAPAAPAAPGQPNVRRARGASPAGSTLEDELARALETPLDFDFGDAASPAASSAASLDAADDSAPATTAAATATDSTNAAATAESGEDDAVDDKVWRDVLAGFEAAQLPEIAAPARRQIPRAVWIVAAVILAGVLIGQVLMTRRDLLLSWPLGHPASKAANLSVYQLRQWGVTGDPAARGTLRVRASILNSSTQPEPYPLLRLTLANRFGNRIGTRDFEPAEYLGKPPGKMLAPAERIDATLDILDPGKDAEGFEIDVCLRGADQQVLCAADAAMQGKP